MLVKACPAFPWLRSEAIASQLFAIAWALDIFTVVFQMRILD